MQSKIGLWFEFSRLRCHYAASLFIIYLLITDAAAVCGHDGEMCVCA